jgi:RHH-type proline utilization regulon transcriptional repressor/proline dehydrogenase/delta 1-pyrroline-5-carboxylate dehydrogenase
MERAVSGGAERGAEPDIEADVLEIGRRLAGGRRTLRAAVNPLEAIMALTASDPPLRAAVFRAVEVAPACRGPRELAEHLAAFLEESEQRSRAHEAARRVLARKWLWPLSGRVTAAAVGRIAARFIAGRDAHAAGATLARMWERGRASSVDLLGEATLTRAQGRAYADRCDAALAELSLAAVRWPARALLERDAAGAIPRVNLSIKVTALTPLVRPEAPERWREDAADHVRRLLRRARELGAHLHIDMESADSTALVGELALELLGEGEFRNGPSAGIVLQAYLADADERLARILAWARSADRTVPLTVRLVKGAYWDREIVEAAQNGWSAPVWTSRQETDRCFERCTRELLGAFPAVRTAIASHNARSLAHAIVCARRLGLGEADFELQVLRGLGDDLGGALAALGLRGRTYSPVGDLVAGMAYLVRRLLENTSNDSFLAGRLAGADLDRLLAAP